MNRALMRNTILLEIDRRKISVTIDELDKKLKQINHNDPIAAFIHKTRLSLIDYVNYSDNKMLDHAEDYHKLHNSMENKIMCATEELIQIIKKQALIIEISGQQFPTINQNIQLIYDIYLVAKGKQDMAGTPFNGNITIPII